MKQIIYLLVLFILFSCSNASYKEEHNNAHATDKIFEDHNLTTYEDIIIQKFENYTDLLTLKEKHPELKEDINIELQNLSKEEIINVLDVNTIIVDGYTVKNIQQISDSVQKAKLVYEKTLKGIKIKDSVFAYIKSTQITINEGTTTAHKIKFAKK